MSTVKFIAVSRKGRHLVGWQIRNGQTEPVWGRKRYALAISDITKPDFQSHHFDGAKFVPELAAQHV